VKRGLSIGLFVLFAYGITPQLFAMGIELSISVTHR
jgi:hypothetical protein